jgi:hypothetical protein
MMMDSEWFVSLEGKECGPFSASYLRQCAQEKRIRPETLVKETRDGKWLAARQVPGLFDIPPQPAATVPDDLAAVEVAEVSAANPFAPGNPQLDLSQGSRVIFCERCGQSNDANTYQCCKCGNMLHASPPPQYAVDNSLGGLIPYKNSNALWAYYLGIFSLFACVPIIGFIIGLPLGIAALIFGLKGRRYAREFPEAKGGVHAWIGIILGILSLVSTTLFLVIFLIAMFSKK